MAFKSFHASPNFTNTNKSLPLPLLITSLLLRFAQFVLGLTVCGLYGVDLNAARKAHVYTDGKWVYAEVVGSLSVVTALVYCLPKVKSWYAFGWDVVLL